MLLLLSFEELVGEREVLLELAGEGVRSLLCLIASFWLSLRASEGSLRSRLMSCMERRERRVLPFGAGFTAGSEVSGSR